jgi:hypothetical protein
VLLKEGRTRGALSFPVSTPIVNLRFTVKSISRGLTKRRVSPSENSAGLYFSKYFLLPVQEVGVKNQNGDSYLASLNFLSCGSVVC